MIATLLALWRAGGLAKYAEMAVGAAMIFLAGFAFGEHVITSDAVHSAVETVQAHADSEQAAQGAALFNWQKTTEKLVAAEAANAQSADDHVHATLTDAAKSAAAARDAALAQLQKERQTNEALRRTNEAVAAATVASAADPPAADPGPVSRCAFSSAARRVLDDAAGSTGEGGDSASTNAPEAAPADGAAPASEAPAAAADELTCDQLYRGYVALGAHDREMIGYVEAWQAWYRDRFPEEE